MFHYKCERLQNVIDIKQQRSLTVRLNLHQELKHYEDDQLHYSDCDEREETFTIDQ